MYLGSMAKQVQKTAARDTAIERLGFKGFAIISFPFLVSGLLSDASVAPDAMKASAEVVELADTPS
jgi:hypothetical protein